MSTDKYKILLAGCGQLGSRHLQAIAALQDVGEIHVVDPNEKSLELGKARLLEIKNANPDIAFRWFKEFDACSSGGDLCIIATQAEGRCALLKKVADTLGYKKFLIEKLVSQSVAEYEDLLSFCQRANVSVWVNCKSRSYAIHRYIRERLSNNGPITYSAIGGDYGLASIGIHYLDLFVFFDNAAWLKSSGSVIDLKLHPSKRGRRVYDLTGIISGYSDKGGKFIISFAKDYQCPINVTISSPKARFIFDDYRQFAYESYAESDWIWSGVPINEDWTVSYMSRKFSPDILRSGTCNLPTLLECFPAHKFILGELLPYFNKLLGARNDYCPVT